MKIFTVAALIAVAALACALVLAPDAAHASTAMACMLVPATTIKPDLAASTMLRPVPRAVTSFGLRADANDPKAMIAALNNAFEEFKKAHDEKLKSKADDTIVNDKLQKIDASIDGFQKIIDDLNAKLAAQATGGVIGDLPADPEYVNAFKAHMRKGDVQAAMTKGVDADGGYTAPIEWDRTITDKLKEISPIRANARVISITGAGFKKLYNDRAVGSGWVGESAARPATTTPQFAILDFVPGEIYANPAISQQLLDDSAVDLEAWLAAEVDTEFARQEGIAFISGNGTNKPFGILTYVTGGANAAKHPWGSIEVVNSGAAAAFTTDGLIDLIYSLPAAFRANAKFYMNRLSQRNIRKLKDGQGNYIWQPSYVAGQPATLLGEPVVEVPDMPAAAADAIAALYGDMAESYLVVDRIGVRILRDPYTNKPFVHFYTTKRVGGGVHNPEAMKAQKIAVNP